MMPDLRARIRAAAEKPKPKEDVARCLVIEARCDLSTMDGLLAVNPAHVRRFGLEYPEWEVRRALFLDTETTGLRGAGTIAFLVGVGWIEEDEFVVRQYLLRDYPEEADQLSQLAELFERFDSVVTFNGKSFDLPLLRDRFTMARLREQWRDLPQLDLLHTARRTWKLRLGRCALGSLEETVLDIHREGDLPGAEVPERFFRFLKTGDESLLDDVLTHNLQDIRTLAVLLARLSKVYDAPHEQTSMLDVFSLGRALDRCGEGEMARRCYHVASVSALSTQARLHLAQSYRRDMDFDRAAETYRGMIARGEADAQVYQALAILLERRLDDIRGALSVTEQALFKLSGVSPFKRVAPMELEALERRRARLRKRLDSAT